MTARVDLDAFRVVYREAVADVLRFVTAERLEAVGRHNPGWAPTAFDHAAYLMASERRYLTALEVFARCGGEPNSSLSVLDAGGFMGAFPLALHRLGARVTLSERYEYYSGAFDELRDYLTGEGVEVWDRDLTQGLEPLPQARFDLVTNMAVLEHLAGSPRPLMRNLTGLLAGRGSLIVEVPNIAYWPKRLGLLMGASPLPPLAHVYEAEEPFTGHHREYTVGELRELLDRSELVVEALVSYNYTPWSGRGLLYRLLEDVPRRPFRSMREVLLACARHREPAAAESPASAGERARDGAGHPVSATR